MPLSPDDPRYPFRLTGSARDDLDRIGRQYDELDRAFAGDPVNGMSPEPQRPLTPLEQAAQLLAETRELTDTANLGRLEELTTALEVLYRDGVGYPFREAIGELGHNLSTARAHLARAARMYAEEAARLTAACDTWADDYRRVSDEQVRTIETLQDEQARRRHAEEVLRHLEDLPGFLEPLPAPVPYQIDADSFDRLRRLIAAHTDYVAGARVDAAQTEPQPGPGPSLRDLLTDLDNRLAAIGRGPHLSRMCREALDSIPDAVLDRRPGPG